ncbi:MAG TPA: tetratricopeptide repeat protein, partial [Pyrinomonadaceae bacterium]
GEIDELLATRNMLAKVELRAKSYVESLTILRETHLLSQLSTRHRLRASTHMGLGNAYEALGDYDSALVEYEAARYHLEEAGDPENAGYVENNIAVVLCALNRTTDAREHIQTARACLKDRPVQFAEIDVTEAQVCLIKGQPFEALALMYGAQQVFIEKGEKRLHDDSLPTLIKAAADYALSQRKPTT